MIYMPRPKTIKVDTMDMLRMKAKGMSYGDIAKKHHVARQSIHKRVTKLLTMTNPEVIAAYRTERKNILTQAEATLLGDMMDSEKRKQASLNNVAYTFRQVFKARRLEEGESTQNVSVQSFATQMQAYHDKLVAMRDATTPSTPQDVDDNDD